jgi:hypothetical protein
MMPAMTVVIAVSVGLCFGCRASQGKSQPKAPAEQNGIEPVSFRDLQALLPTLQGWDRDEPSGERMTSPVKISQAAVDLRKGDSEVTVKITDLSLAPVVLEPFMRHRDGNYEHEDGDSYERAVKLADADGLEKWNSRTKTGDLAAIVANRFLVEIEGRHVDHPNVLRQTLERTDLKRLAALR